MKLHEIKLLKDYIKSFFTPTSNISQEEVNYDFPKWMNITDWNEDEENMDPNEEIRKIIDHGDMKYKLERRLKR